MKSVKPSQSYINQDRASSLLKKCAPLLDHADETTAAIKDDHTRLNTAILLENQEQWCLNEAGGNTAGYQGAFGSAATMNPGFGGKPSSDFYG